MNIPSNNDLIRDAVKQFDTIDFKFLAEQSLVHNLHSINAVFMPYWRNLPFNQGEKLIIRELLKAKKLSSKKWWLDIMKVKQFIDYNFYLKTKDFMNEIMNAEIESVNIHKVRDMFFELSICIKYSSNLGQCFSIYLGNSEHPGKLKSMLELFEVLRIESLDELKGQKIRVKARHSKVMEIAHWCNDDWLKV